MRIIPFVLSAIALLSITACQASSPDAASTDDAPTDEVVESSAPESTDEATTDEAPMDGAEEMLVMEQSGTLEAYCNSGEGVLAISFVGEADIDGQLLGCEPSFEAFDAVRENSFADITRVAPMVADDALQLQESEYLMVSCQGERVSLAPVLPDNSDGHMTLECF